MKKWGNIEKAF